jgi:hypothetical protein
MKTVFIGDIHGRSIWKEIVEQEKPDRVIFVGDYFDSLDIPGIDQIHNFKEIIHHKKTSGIEVVLLVGNHDYHYMDMGETYSGFQPALKFDIGQLLKENMEHLQMAHSFDNFLCTHAGVSSVFMNDNFRGSWDCDNLVEKLNETFKYSPFIFKFNGFNPYGDNETQSPIWIRLNSLRSSNNKRGKDGIKKQFIQVFGHTQVKEIDLVGMAKFLGGRYIMIDALPSRQYLIYNGEIKVGKV